MYERTVRSRVIGFEVISPTLGRGGEPLASDGNTAVASATQDGFSAPAQYALDEFVSWTSLESEIGALWLSNNGISVAENGSSLPDQQQNYAELAGKSGDSAVLSRLQLVADSSVYIVLASPEQEYPIQENSMHVAAAAPISDRISTDDAEINVVSEGHKFDASEVDTAAALSTSGPSSEEVDSVNGDAAPLYSDAQGSVASYATVPAGPAGPFSASPGYTPSLGVNLEDLAYYTPSLPMLDLMKTGAPLFGLGPNQVLDLDANGWARSIPAGDYGIGVGVIANNPAALPNARYVVLYEGQGTLEGRFDTKVVGSGSTPGSLIIQTGGDGSIALQITATDPHKTGDYLRDIHVVREDLLPLYQAGLTFDPAFIDKLEDFHTVRFMQWMNTNKIYDKSGAEIGWDQLSDVGLIDWADRPQVDDATWNRGAPVEVMVDLANRIGADPWFTMPVNASDDYVRGFATYVRDNVRPDLNVHVEYSNEVWNWGFYQASYVWAHAQADMVTPNWMEWYGKRTAEIGRIWNEAFDEPATGSGDPGRVSVVYNTQFAWKGLEQYGLETSEWTDANGNHVRAADYFDEYAVTGYYGGGGGSDAITSDKVASWQSDPNGYQYALEALSESITSYNAPTYKYHADKAQQYGLELVTYESGFSDQTPYSQMENQAYTDFLVGLQRDPGIYDIEMQNYAAFKDAGGGLYMNFDLIASASKWGSWGALESLTQDTSPRYEALTDWNASVAPWYESGRDAVTFENARYYVAGNGGETIAGTLHGYDVLVGGTGDDVFVPYGGGSNLDGREGQDTLMLPGASIGYMFQQQDGSILVSGYGAHWTIQNIEQISIGSEPPRQVHEFLV